MTVRGLPASKLILNAALLRELLYYDPVTGEFIWLAREICWFTSRAQMKRWNSRHAGKRAGSPSARGKAMQIYVLGKPHKSHRLAWIYMKDEKPPSEIDHINGNPMDNAWVNLRDGSGGVNQKNKKLYSVNTSGVSGVTWHKRDLYWQARAGSGGARVYLGGFSNKADAEQAVLAYREEHGYTDRHGAQK